MDGESMAWGEKGMLTFAQALCGLYLPGAGEDRRAGQGLVEYALLLGTIAMLMYPALGFLKEQILTGYSGIVNGIPRT